MTGVATCTESDVDAGTNMGSVDEEQARGGDCGDDGGENASSDVERYDGSRACGDDGGDDTGVDIGDDGDNSWLGSGSSNTLTCEVIIKFIGIKGTGKYFLSRNSVTPHNLESYYV